MRYQLRDGEKADGGGGEAGRETGELQYAGWRSRAAVLSCMAEEVWGRG